MKKRVIIVLTLCALCACEYHTKQTKDEIYYKRTQGIEWPEEQRIVAQKTTKAISYGATADSQLNAQGVAASVPQLAAPEALDKKLQCVKTDRKAYACRLGQYPCGTGCQADGSNCRFGYCLQSDCDDVMGQKWDLVYQRDAQVYACQHPTAKVSCRPFYGKISCWNADGNSCGRDCNKNGTQCAAGPDTCWAEYHNVY